MNSILHPSRGTNLNFPKKGHTVSCTEDTILLYVLYICLLDWFFFAWIYFSVFSGTPAPGSSSGTKAALNGGDSQAASDNNPQFRLLCSSFSFSLVTETESWIVWLAGIQRSNISDRKWLRARRPRTRQRTPWGICTSGRSSRSSFYQILLAERDIWQPGFSCKPKNNYGKESASMTPTFEGPPPPPLLLASTGNP